MTNHHAFDPISVVEAAYTFGDPDDWLETVTDRIAAHFPDRTAMIAHVLSTHDGIRTVCKLENYEDPDAPPLGLSPQSLEDLPDFFTDVYHQGLSGLATTSDALGGPPREHPDLRPFVEHADYFGDFAAVCAHDPSGYTIDIGAVLPDVYDTNPDNAEIWRRLNTHLANGFRLNRKVSDLGADLDSADAILEPDGEIAHAAGDDEKRDVIRDALRTAAIHIERARTELRGDDPRRALELWQGLVRGTYSLVEHVDTDDRRFYIARRNDPTVDKPTGLSRRERQVARYAGLGYDNARIAYELGLARSTIATYLRRALDKLGLDSRIDLIRFARRTLGPSPE